MSSYKSKNVEGTVSSVIDAYQELMCLSEECREIVDNASGTGLENTQRIQTLDETASALEYLSEPNVPICVESRPITWPEVVQTRKGRTESREVRRANCLAVFEAAKDECECLRDEQETILEEWLATEDAEHDEMLEPELSEEDLTELAEFMTELDELISEAEGVEFPGMFG